MAYVELHARSAFSFLEGASLPEELASRCAEIEQPALALLDVDGVYGAPRFHLAANKLGIRALIGAEVHASDGTRYSLLAENRTGYQNLCRLITRMKLRGGQVGKPQNPYATDDDFAEYAQGLICLTGGDEGPLAPIFNELEGPAARDRLNQRLDRLAGIFGKPHLYVELQRHCDRDVERRVQALAATAHRRKLPLLATNGVHYASAEKRDLADVLTCIKHKTSVAEAGRLLHRNSERYLKTSREMQVLFADLPAAYANTGELAARLQFTLEDLGYQFPRVSGAAGRKREFLSAAINRCRRARALSTLLRQGAAASRTRTSC